MRAKPHVLIAGAGIGGLTAAVALLDRGFRISVFERVPQLRGIGAGFHFTPNGVRVLRALGLKDAGQLLADVLRSAIVALCRLIAIVPGDSTKNV